MRHVFSYLVDTVIPRILEGLVAVVVVPIILTSYRYASRPSNLNSPTPASVCQLEQQTTTFEVKKRSSVILPFQKIGVLAAFESGYLGTRINPILTKGALVLRQENADLGELTDLSENLLLPELSENILLGELVSRIEQVESTIDLSDSSESLDHSYLSDSDNLIDPAPDMSSFKSYDNPYYGADEIDPAPDMSSFSGYDNPYYGADEEDETRPV